MLIRYLISSNKLYTSFPDHFDLARKLNIQMKGFDFCDEEDFVNFEVFAGHVFLFVSKLNFWSGDGLFINYDMFFINLFLLIKRFTFCCVIID